MLKKIKSTYFSKIIFTYLDTKRKLNLIKYNKRLQGSLNINIIHYKLLNGKLILNKGKDLWKVYDAFNFDLIFEGNYFNGIGKEYYNDDKIVFEGEYINGKKNGYGKEYSFNGKIISEGSYKSGLKNGKFKEYYNDGKIFFEGEYMNGKEWNSKVYDKDGNIICEKKNGEGIGIELSYSDNIEFKGEYSNGLKNGKGKEYYEEGKLFFEGNYLNDLRHGDRIEFYNDKKVRFKGEYFYGRKWNIKGYDKEGKIINELKNGKGIIKQFYNNGNLFRESEYLFGLMNGKGKEYYENGKVFFEGEYLNGLKNGKGKIFNDKGELKFEGEFFNNWIIEGKVYLNKKLEYEGKYLYNRKFHGKGYDENSNIIYNL